MRYAFAFWFSAALLGLPAISPWAQQHGHGAAAKSDATKKTEKKVGMAKTDKGGKATMSTGPAPKTGSMPKGGPAPTGKLGTEPASKAKLGTDPRPDEPQSKPPRPL